MPYQVAHAANTRIVSYLTAGPGKLQEQVQEKRRLRRRRIRPGRSAAVPVRPREGAAS
jgi:hypothetical protein